jgi:cytoskeletal protein RodZ
VSIGDTLAEARRQAGLTVTQVSKQTRIRESLVRAIEHSDFIPCGGDFYARGHIRSIAEVVGVDPAPLIRQYDEEHASQVSMRAAQIFEPVTPIKIREPGRGRFGKAVAVVALAAVGFGVYQFATRTPHTGHPSANAAATLRPQPAAKEKAKPAVHSAARTARQAPAYPAGTAVISVVARQPCWVGLSAANGRSLGQTVVQAGQSRTWKERSKVALTVGNPSGVTLRVNGRVERLQAGRVAHVSINPAGKSPTVVS